MVLLVLAIGPELPGVLMGPGGCRGSLLVVEVLPMHERPQAGNNGRRCQRPSNSGEGPSSAAQDSFQHLESPTCCQAAKLRPVSPPTSL